MTDRGLAALTAVLQLHVLWDGMAPFATELAATILGERAVFLPEGRDDDLAYTAGLEDGRGEAEIATVLKRLPWAVYETPTGNYRLHGAVWLNDVLAIVEDRHD